MSDSESRRHVLKKLGVAGAAAWTAPAVLSTPAFAQGGTPPPPTGCLCGVELVTNGSFEANVYAVPTGWTKTGTSNSVAIPWSDLVPVPVPAPPTGAGSNAGVLRQSSTFSQTIAVDAACAGKTYSFSSYAMASLSTGQIELAFDGSGTTAWTAALPSSTIASLVNYATNGVVPAGTTSITITFTFNGGNFMPIDLVSLTIAC